MKQAKPIRVKIVGCGGIGCELIPTLSRYLAYAYDKYSTVEITLIDGDSYEPGNSARQHFKSTINKAQETANSLTPQFPRILFKAFPHYLMDHNVAEVIQEGDVVMSCVDNHDTRLLISNRCCKLNNVVFVSGGNDYEDGNLQVHVRENGKNKTLPIANRFHPEILNPTDMNPGKRKPVEEGCEKMIETSSPQLLFTNKSIASFMLNCLWTQQDGRLKYDEVYVDVVNNRAREVVRFVKGVDE